MNVGRIVRNCCLGSLGILALSWAGIVNGQPFFYPDTSAYVRSADMAFYKLAGIASPWTEREASGASGKKNPELAPEKRVVLSGRSPYYGAVLFALDRTVGMWGVVALQAALVLACLHLTALRLGTRGAAPLAPLLVVLCATTTLPFYVSELMPDILAPLAVLAAANLLLPAPSQRSISTPFCALVLLFAIVSHTSHFAIVAAIFVAAMAVRLVAASGMFGNGATGNADAPTRLAVLGVTIPTVSPRGLRVLAALLVMGAVAEAAMSFGIEKALGSPPVRPPFLTARLLGDGTGARYLAKTCPQSGFAACAYANRPPITSGEFLWSEEPGVGAFSLAEPATKRRLSEEQGRFALAVIADDPCTQAAVSARNWMVQTVSFSLRDFNYPDGMRAFVREKLPSGYASAGQQTLAYRRVWPLFALDILVYVTVGVSALFIFGVLVAGSRRGFAVSDELRLVVLVVLFGVVANAAVCGILAVPEDRFQARVVWLLPFVALLLYRTRTNLTPSRV